MASFAPSRQQDYRPSFDRWNVKRASCASSSSFRETALLLACILLGGCRYRDSLPRPAIEFTRVPPAAGGGPDKLDIIEGRVRGARPGLQVVLYARNGNWWVQPLVGEPFTRIGADSKWINSTHLGTEYAALLVDAGFQPAPRLDELPSRGGSVAAVAITKGSPPASAISKTLQFSGYEWRIRNAPSDRGGLNAYDDSDAWVDSHGALHLRIAKVAGQWTCAEVTLTRSLGYGTYSFVVQDSHLEPAAVLSMFTWDYAGAEQNHREMDIEISRWGDPTNKNAQYIVQPYYIPENAFRFTVPSGVLTHSFRWEPGRTSFKTVRGSKASQKAPLVAEHVFTSGIPSSGIESVRMNLYIFHGGKQALQNETEVTIEKFEYLP